MSHVCKEAGVVVRAEAHHIYVRIERADACHGCEAEGACRTLGGKAKAVELRVENTLDAKPGDTVVLALPEVNVLKASAAVYLIPAATLIGGALAGNRIGPGEDLSALLGAAAGLLVGLGLSRLIGRRLGDDPRYVPKLVEIISPRE